MLTWREELACHGDHELAEGDEIFLLSREVSLESSSDVTDLIYGNGGGGIVS